MEKLNIIIVDCYRPGGRIHSCFLGDVVCELGAHWKNPNKTNHLIYQISASEEPPRPGVPGTIHPRGLFNRVVTGKMEYPPTLSAYNKFRQIEKEAAALYCLGGSKQQGSLINFISLRIQQELHEFPLDQQHDAARIMFGMAHTLSARCGDDTAMLSGCSEGCFMNMPGGVTRVPLGLLATLAPILRQIPEGCIKYCRPVNCVYWGTSQKMGYRAIVCTTDGEEFPCDYVICTVSLGVLRANSAKLFCPALPASKMDAMRCLGFGYCNKIYLEYYRPFWFWYNGKLDFNFKCAGGDKSDWTRGIKSLEVVPNSNHVLSALVVGEEAVMMEGLCDKDIAESITDILRKAIGDSCVPYPCTILRSHWSTDPFFLGAYSFDCSCLDGDCQRALGCPIPGPSEPFPPILLFAGEATVPGHFATVAGARLSGVREAERIIQLTLQFQGPPLPVSSCRPAKEVKKCKASN